MILQTKQQGDHQKLDELLASLERNAMERALRDARGNRTVAARRLGISRSRLYRRIEALGLSADYSAAATSEAQPRAFESQQTSQPAVAPGVVPGVIAHSETRAADVVANSANESVFAEGLDTILARAEREQIVRALRRSGGERAGAARDLAISRSRLYRRIESLGIEHCAPSETTGLTPGSSAPNPESESEETVTCGAMP